MSQEENMMIKSILVWIASILSLSGAINRIYNYYHSKSHAFTIAFFYVYQIL